MRTIKLIVEYDGTGLSGWQRQKNGPSVQQFLEQALAKMVGAKTPIQGASRTDAGVHAMGQTAHFHTESAIAVHGFRRGLNTMLPPAICVVSCTEAAPSFHARFDASGKHYCYAVLTRAERSPLFRDRAWHRPGPLDLDAMRRAAAHMIGEKDFSALRAAGCTAATATRRVDSIEIVPTSCRPDSISSPEMVHLHVRGNAFLRNMVRIMAGTLVDVGKGRIAPDQVAEIIANRHRSAAGQTAPAHGLTLMQVFYKE